MFDNLLQCAERVMDLSLILPRRCWASGIVVARFMWPARTCVIHQECPRVPAGCPTAVANLWDVTDVDIDRFARGVLDQWLGDEQVVILTDQKHLLIGALAHRVSCSIGGRIGHSVCVLAAVDVHETSVIETVCCCAVGGWPAAAGGAT